MQKTNYRFGIFLAYASIVLAVAYLAALFGAAASPQGFPPVEPYDVIISVICLLSAPSILLLFAVFHDITQPQYRLYSQSALAFATLFCAMTSINRFIHLAVVRPSYAIGRTDGLEWFTPYGASSIMGALEILAWGFFLGLAFLCAAAVLQGSRQERGFYWLCLGNGILCLVSTLTPITGIVLFTFLGVPAWGPGFILFCLMLVRLLRKKQGEGSLAVGSVPA